MKQKKQSSNWYIAATHYLTAGFAIPLIIGVIAGFVIVPFITAIGSEILVMLFVLVISSLSVWLGVMYSARYLKRTYIISNPGAIIKLSTAYGVILGGGFLTLQIFMNDVSLTTNLYDLMFLGVRVAVFYVASNKYIGNINAQPSAPITT